MTDNGLAALAAALSAAAHDDGRHYWCKDRNDCGLYGYAEEFAAAILGPRGVFLPDGLDGLIPWTCIYCEGTWSRDEPITVLQDHIRVCDKHPLRVADATIATLRAALDGLVEAGRSYIDAVDADLYREGTPEDWWEREATLAALRAALATAKETP